MVARVQEAKTPPEAARAAAGRRAGAGLPDPRGDWRRLPPRFYLFLGVLLLFALGNSADAFLLLRLTDLGIQPAFVPLLWAAHHVVKAVMSVTGGVGSDRVGRRRVIAAGWLVYVLVYAGFAVTTTAGWLVVLFLIYGLYYGLAEATEKALVADLAPADLRGTAFGLYNAVLGVGALAASVVFGLIWKAAGAPAAFGAGASLALVATILLWRIVRQERPA
jgi:MFS family permease